MPTYEYRCTQCHQVFERVQRVGDPAPTCPACGRPTRKVYSSVGLIFKGKGFHTTDYRKPAPSDGEAKPSATKDAAASSSSKDGAGSSSTGAPAASGTSSKES